MALRERQRLGARALLTTLAFAIAVKRVVRFGFRHCPKRALILAVLLLATPVVVAWLLTDQIAIRLAVAFVAFASYAALIMMRVLTDVERNKYCLLCRRALAKQLRAASAYEREDSRLAIL